MAAVAAKETRGYDVDALNYALRSHILLAVLRLAIIPSTSDEYREYSNKIRQVSPSKGAKQAIYNEWIDNVLKLMQPYTAEQKESPDIEKGRTALLHKVLAENGQLFARGGWKLPASSRPERYFKFDLELAFNRHEKEVAASK